MSKIVLLFVNYISKCPSASPRVGAVLSAVHSGKGAGVVSVLQGPDKQRRMLPQHPVGTWVEAEGWVQQGKSVCGGNIYTESRMKKSQSCKEPGEEHSRDKKLWHLRRKQ